jgi:hypothetical protein
MKKTLLFTMFISAFVITTNAQLWDFNNTDDGWSGPFTVTTGPEFITLTCNDGAKNPKFEQKAADINTENVHILAVTLKNKSDNGPEFLRVSYVKSTDAGRIYFDLDITNGDTEFITYYFDLSNANQWKGTKDDIMLHFKAAGGSDFIGTGTEVIEIDKIEMLDAIPVTEKHIWNFDTDGDAENWAKTGGTIESVSNSILTFSPNANQYSRIIQSTNYVVADDYNWLRLKVKNNSTGDKQITLITSIARINFPVSTEDTEFKTYEILLDTIGIGATGSTSWTGNAKNITFRFSDGTTGKSSGTGTFEIDLIEFFQAPATRISKTKAYDLSVGPNPSNGVFRINSEKPISGYTVYNTTGQVVKQVSSAGSNVTMVDISGGNKGLYFIKVKYENGETQVVRALIK